MTSDRATHLKDRSRLLFQPDTLAPAEYFATFCKKVRREPETDLMSAVLQDAIDCFQTHVLAQNTRGKRLFVEAESWLLDKDCDWIFSFENICEALGIDPNFLRKELLRWKEKKLAEISAARSDPPKKQRTKRRFRVARRRSKKEELRVGNIGAV
jgi:hypothetical protein